MTETNKIQFIIEIDEHGQPVIKGVGKDFDDLEKKAKKTGSTFGEVSSAWRAMTAAMAALGIVKIVGEIGEMIDKAEEQRKAVAGMETAMRSMGRYSPELSGQLQDVATSLQQVTNFGDEATLQGQKFLLTYRDITDDLLPRSTVVMQDLAALMGGDVVQAANMLGKASMGMTGELRRVGISVDSNTYKTQGYLGVLKEIETQVSGQAKAMRDPWTQLDNVIGDSKEALGGFLGLAFRPFAEDMISLLPHMTKSWREVAEAINETRRVEAQYQIEQLKRQLEGKGFEFFEGGTMAPGFVIEGMTPEEEKMIRAKLERYQEILKEVSKGAAGSAPPAAAVSAVPIRDELADIESLKNAELELMRGYDEKLKASREASREEYVDLWQTSAADIYDAQSRAYDAEIELSDQRKTALESEIDTMMELINSHDMVGKSLSQLMSADQAYIALRGAVKNALVASILGYESFGAAMKKAVSEMLAQIAAEAAIRALLHTAFGIAALTPWGAAVYGPASAQFQAAAIFAAVAIGAGVAAKSMAASAGGVSAGESAGYQESRGSGVQSGAAESLGREADQRRDYGQKWDVTIVNPIGTKDWVENNLVPELKKVAKRDTEITVTYR